MPLVEQLNEDMKQAMKNKEKDRLAVIRMLKASLQNETIKLGNKNLSEDEELTVLSRELKQRKDSLQDFKSAEREDLISKLETEINVIEAYMPYQLTDEELEAVVTSTIQEVNASSKKDMGTVMNAIMPKVKGKADGARINKMVQKHLNA
ncbi:GatB/YqeY domain-containing protein [Lentibacillus cibarius]|uniref:GatB/YqeY domain-containing protein n=1 Tax=Lentibacillus cibarius TaxID=2583219 RepID=A0A549YLI4_9BACI|nr:GatB/YqeY domain-containing protein [Lentibacillus cibarius]TRM12745.1 GatB/YqeY domain-containing protein [Lentibacillus cibarius]